MTLPVPLKNMGIGVYEDILYIFNGYLDNTLEYSASFDYNLSSNVVWATQNISDFYFDTNSPRYYIYYFGQSVIQKGDIVYGAFPTIKLSNSKALMKYSLINHSYIDTNTYNAIRSSGRGQGACAAFDSNLNVVYSLSYYHTEYYNISNDSWAYFSNPNQMTSFSGCAMDINSEYIFKFGGYRSSYLDIIEKYNVSNNSWVILSNVTLIQPMCCLQCLWYENGNNEVYCTGGFNGVGYYSAVHVFGVQSLTMDYVSYSLNVLRGYHRMVVSNNCLFAMGGENSGGLLDSIEYLCLASDFRSYVPTFVPTLDPTLVPTLFPSFVPTLFPSLIPSLPPSLIPSLIPSLVPTLIPSLVPTLIPTLVPTLNLTLVPTLVPSRIPTDYPSILPTLLPAYDPSYAPSVFPSKSPTMTTIAPNVQTNDMSVSVTLIVVVVGAFVCFCAIIIACVCAVIWHRKKPKAAVIRTAGYEYTVKPVVEIQMESFYIQSNVQLPAIPKMMVTKGEYVFESDSSEHQNEGITDGQTFGI